MTWGQGGLRGAGVGGGWGGGKTLADVVLWTSNALQLRVHLQREVLRRTGGMASGVPGEALAVARSGAQPWPRLHPPGPLATVGVLSPQAAVRSPTCAPEGGCQPWRVPGLGERTGRGGWSAGQLQVPVRAGGVPPCRETQRPRLWGSAEQGCRAQGAEASAEQGRACAADGEGRAPSRTPFSPGTGARGPAV